jgi:hypothetical protein
VSDGTEVGGSPRPAPATLGDRLQRHPWLVYLALTPLAHPILEILLFGERALQTAHDVFDDDVPRLFSIAADWREFGPSLWDPHLTGGNALLAQFALPPLAPDVVLSFFVSPYAAYTLNAALLAFLAGLSMHLFLRHSLRLGTAACFAGGLLSLFGFWHYIYGYAGAMLPLVLLWSERAAAPERRRADVVRLAVLVAFLVFSSQVQVVAVDAGVAVLWVAVTSRAGERVRGVARMTAGWLAGAALAAPVLLTIAAGLGDSQRTIWELDPIRNPIGAWVDQLETLAFGVRVGGLGGFQGTYGSFFPGVIGLLLLALSIGVPRRSPRARAALAVLGGLLVADLVAILAVPVQEQVWFLRSFQFVRVLHLVPVAIVFNIALALEWLRARPPGEGIGRPRVLLLALLAVAAVLALGLQAAAIARPLARWLADGASLANLEQTTAGWLLGAAAFAAGVVGAGSALVLVAAALWRRRRAAGTMGTLGTTALACLVIGLAADRAVFTRSGLLLRSDLGTWADWMPPTPAHEFVAAQDGGRVLSVLEHANRSMGARLAAADGYQVLYPVRYHGLFGLLIAPQLAASPDLATYFGTWGNRAYAFTPDISEPIADLLGIRWVLVADAAIDPDLAERAGEQAPVPAWLVARAKLDGITVYDNAGAMPRTFVVHAATEHPDPGAALDAIAADDAVALRARVHLVAGNVPDGVAVGLQGEPTVDAGDTATVDVDTPDALEIRTTSERPGILVVADTYARGWVAEVDGIEAEVFPVDVALRGVALPAGSHSVVLRYRPIETYLGFALAGLTLLGLASWLAASRVRRNATGA